MNTVTVSLGPRSYDVRIGPGVLGAVGEVVGTVLPDARRAAIITQRPALAYAERVDRSLTERGLVTALVPMEDGEAAKSLDSVAALYDALAAVRIERSDVVVAVGGGVVGDVAGFVAATWHRGVALVQLPTTLLAQVDAAIGGKTAIDLPAGKNLVGAFHQPRAVLADTTTLATLDHRDLIAGMAEIVKCGLIRDPSILEVLEGEGSGATAVDDAALTGLITAAVRVKAEIVSADEHESGARAHLNLGHTYGHALETLTGYDHFRHGEAVALGTCVALRVGRDLELTPGPLVERTESLLSALGLPTRGPRLDRRALWDTMARDKKARGAVRFVLLEGVAKPVVTVPPVEVVDRAIDQIETR